MLYHTGRTGDETTRELDPYRVWYRSGGLYVVGLDHHSGEIRTFAVERIEKLQQSEQRFQVPADFDFEAWSASSFGVVTEPATKVRIRFDKRWAAYVGEHTWHASQQIEEGPRCSVELCMEVGGTSELFGWIISFGPGAEVL